MDAEGSWPQLATQNLIFLHSVVCLWSGIFCIISFKGAEVTSWCMWCHMWIPHWLQCKGVRNKKCSKRSETSPTPPKLPIANKYTNMCFSLKCPEGGVIRILKFISGKTATRWHVGSIMMCSTPTNSTMLNLLIYVSSLYDHQKGAISPFFWKGWELCRKSQTTDKPLNVEG